MVQTATITLAPLSLDRLWDIHHGKLRIQLDPSVLQRLAEQRMRLDELTLRGDTAYYGVNTGFGALCNVIIPDKQLDELQSNLIRSHACGFGNPVSESVVKLCLLLKIITLSKGFSAVRPELLLFLVELYNRNLLPKVPSLGSLGASGDLAPLAHLCLPCIGEGVLVQNGKECPTSVVLEREQLSAPLLKAKEGLALLNGTQYSLALLIHSLWEADRLYHISNLTATLSFEAFNCSPSFLHPEIHLLRNQPGQIHAAECMRHWLEGSDLSNRPGKSVQDPYSFRCAPQVHGACRDLIESCKATAGREINAITDNPILLSSGEIVSGGNFHAEVLAFSSDTLGLALCELANISERRLYQLVCGQRGLPDFLTEDPGVKSGFMIVQYAAAAAVSLNKQLATPASVDSIVSSKGQEDHVSMAANAGWKNQIIVQNVYSVLAMEWMTAVRAFSFRKAYLLSPSLGAIFQTYIRSYPIELNDHVPSIHYDACIAFLKQVITNNENSLPH